MKRCSAHSDAQPPPVPAPAYLRLGVPAFGLFRHHDAGRDLGDQARYVPSGTPAVYVCAAAFERLAGRCGPTAFPRTRHRSGRPPS